MTTGRRLTNEIIDAAIVGFEQQKRKLDAQIAELRSLRTGNEDSAAASTEAPKRKMSAKGRRAIAAAQRKRWAAVKSNETKPAKKAKRRLSPEGKAAIVAAAKKRWAAKRAADAAKK